MTQEFKVKAGEFEGPIELLLALIERRKLHISEVSLAQVADSYIEHVRTLERFPMADTANFIVVASTLLLIKSMSLLPGLEITEEERESIEDLEERLRIYKEIKHRAGLLARLFGQSPMFARVPGEPEIVFSPSTDITLASLGEALKRVLADIPKPEQMKEAVIRKVRSIEEAILDLSERVKKNLKMSFRDFAGMGKKEKVEVVVNFLAMLELVRQGMLDAVQHTHFQDIELSSRDYSGVPRYD